MDYGIHFRSWIAAIASLNLLAPHGDENTILPRTENQGPTGGHVFTVHVDPFEPSLASRQGFVAHMPICLGSA